MKTVLTCAKLCLALYYDDGFPIQGMPEKCFCAEVVDKKTQPPLPITLHLPKEKTPEPERYDDRETRKYDE